MAERGALDLELDAIRERLDKLEASKGGKADTKTGKRLDDLEAFKAQLLAELK